MVDENKIQELFSAILSEIYPTRKGQRPRSTYVLEYLLGQYCATSDEATIATGMKR